MERGGETGPKRAGPSERQLLWAGVLFGAGLCVGVWAGHARLLKPRMVETRSVGTQFTNPLLECDIAGVAQSPDMRLLKRDIQKIISREIALRHIRFAAAYFRDLNNGPWFGINEDEKFAPASLLKVPLMIAYLRWAEQDAGVPGKRLCFQKSADPVEPNISSARRLQLGQCYAVSELVERMIVDSDNEAKDLLLSNLGMDRYRASYEDLGVETPTNPGDTMSVKDYASFFRVLFNATYLSPAMSEKALGMLSRVEFQDGLRAGVPVAIPLAHKFGERRIGAMRQLHDCGVVYYPGHPYLLCVMSRGADLGDMDDVIAGVSRAVYVDMTRRFPRAAMPGQLLFRSAVHGGPGGPGGARRDS